MANELRDALVQVKEDLGELVNVNKVQLGPMLTAIPEATESKAVVSVTMRQGQPDNSTLVSTTDYHKILFRVYWLLIDLNVEIVEQSMASFWDELMVKFFGDDADRNLSEKATIALIGGVEGTDPYECGYEEVGGKLHRVMLVPLEIVLDTHSV